MGKRIQTRRKELRIKQAMFAETLNISTNHLSAIENGKEKPSFDTFVNICNCAVLQILSLPNNLLKYWYSGMQTAILQTNFKPKTTKICLFIRIFCIYLLYMV